MAWTKERRHQYYLDNKNHIKKKSKVWKLANPERAKELNKVWKSQNVERVRELGRNWMMKKRTINTLQGIKEPPHIRRTKPDPFKVKVRAALWHQVRIGVIVRPLNCEACGKSCAPRGHHHDYSKPYDVLWVCKECHGKLHRKSK